MSIPTPPPTFGPIEVPGRYLKAIVAIVTAVLTVFAAATTDGVVSSLEIANVGIAFLTAFGVYAIPNIKDQTVGAWAKAIVAVVGTGLQALVPFLVTGDLTTSQWLLVLLAALGALTVGIVPNADPEKVAIQQAVATSNVPTTVVLEPSRLDLASGGFGATSPPSDTSDHDHL